MPNSETRQTQTRQDVMDELLAQVAATMQQLPVSKKTDWQLLEVKQLAEIAYRYREKARLNVQALRVIERRRQNENDEVERIYAGYEAMFARDNVRASVRLYRIANRDFHHAYADYMSKVSQNAFSWISTLAHNQNKTTGTSTRAA